MRITTPLAFCVVMLFVAGLVTANDENHPDTLMIQSIELEKAGPVAMQISFVNDEELAALTIPLAIVGDGFQIDSLSFAGSRVEYLKMRPVTIADDRQTVVFGAICMTEDYIPTGKGLMATLFLSPTPDAKKSECLVDTTTIGPASALFTKTNSASFVPKFSAGKVAVKSKAVKKTTEEKPDSKDN